MRKIVMIVAVCMLSMQMMAAYYVAGNGSAGNPWCDGKSWQVNGSAMTDMGNGLWSITFANVPVSGDYQFKVTNGSSTWMGYEKYSSDGSNIYATSSGGDQNISFSISEPQDITITYNGSKICVNGTIGNDAPDPSKYWEVGVPAEYEGVMLQAFYWEAQKLTDYSRMKYVDLLNSGLVDEMGTNFDLVWMPPSGMGGGVGYYTRQYSNLDSDWGSKAKLLEVLERLHAKGCKVLADIVINHFNSKSGWAKSFYENNFGTYGTYQITSEHICAGDEAFSDSQSDSRSLPHGAADTGTNDGGCRDLDHTSTYVQNMCKAYTQWMINTIGFDGFRYDMTLGYHGKYLSMYNLASKPFFSVSECWSDVNTIKAHLEAASYNTLAFDFPTKYKFNSWKGGSTYSNLKKPGMRALGLTRNAVTFIDNHDTFRRSNGQEFLGDNTDISQKKRQIIEANAYLLMMPGVPCVFWPHWYTFKSDINKLIAIRKRMGIHSESEVTDEVAATNKYSATITGHHGKVILRMGSARDMSEPAGYEHAYTGDNFDIYTAYGTGVEAVQVQSPATKVLENGTLYIVRDGERYTVDGRKTE